MKIGIEFGTLENGYKPKWGKDAMEVFKSHGFSCVDFSLVGTDGWAYNDKEEEAIEKLKKELKELESAGIEISQVHGPWRFPPKDYTKEDREERMEKMKRSIRLTAALGCKRWVIHPIMPFGIEDIGTGNEDKTWEINKAFMAELLDEAKANGVTICFENMPFPKLSIASPESIVKFVDEMNDESFKICLDTGHANIFPEKGLGDVVRLMGKRIEALHVHDNDSTDDYHWIPYIGNIDWDAFGKALSEIGFEGVFSYETRIAHNMPKKSFELMNRALVKIAEEIVSK